MHTAALKAVTTGSSRPLYLRLAEALTPFAGGLEPLPPARSLATELHLDRGTVTAAYRVLSRQGLLELRPGRPRRRVKPAARHVTGLGALLDLARYAPDAELLPAGRIFEWLGVGCAEGETVAQYGDAQGYRPLREWVAGRLANYGVAARAEGVVLTGGVQNGLDLVFRAVVRPGDRVLVEDPTYPGLPPLLALHGAEPVALPVGVSGHEPEALGRAGRHRARLAVLTPTLHNPTGTILGESDRRSLLAELQRTGCTVIEEFFEPALVCDGPVPPPLAALSSEVLVVGSFSKALFPGLRVGFIAGNPALVGAVSRVRMGSDLGGSPFLEAAAWTLCQRGILDSQCARLREAARTRRDMVLGALRDAPRGVVHSRPRGGFSLLVGLPPGWSSRALAERAAARGVQVLPGPAMSVSGRNDVLRVAFAAEGGADLQQGVTSLVEAMNAPYSSPPLV